MEIAIIITIVYLVIVSIILFKNRDIIFGEYNRHQQIDDFTRKVNKEFGEQEKKIKQIMNRKENK